MLNNWTKKVKKGDYVRLLSTSNSAEESLREVTDVSDKSVFISRMQFSKETSIQTNNKRKIAPFMAQHVRAFNEA